MSLEVSLLSVVKERKKFNKLYRSIPKESLTQNTQILLKDFDRYFKEHEGVEAIEHDSFMSWFKLTAHPKLSDEGKSLFEQQLRLIHKPLHPSIEAGLMNRLVANDIATRMYDAITKFNDGEDIDFLHTSKELVREFEEGVKKKVKSCEVTTSMEEMMEEDANDFGFHWRLDCLNMSMRPLRGGDFGIIAGRPDKGKTTFMTDQLTYMAKQVDVLFPNENRSILWLNNEGPGKRIKYRCYQSALDATASELLEKQKAGTLQSEYEAAVGRHNAIRVFDIHGLWNHEVQEIVEYNDPALVVMDMIDNIRFGGDATNNGQRTDQLLEAMYQWGRMMAVVWDKPVLATSQISADGDGLQFPTLPMLKDSKTGKQGAAEFIITIGALNEITAQNTRFIGMTKNKLHREGGPRDPRAEVIFDGLKGRYRMPV